MASRIIFSEDFRDLFKKSFQTTDFSFLPDHNTIKHWIEYFNVPHTEVGEIRLRDQAVGFDCKPQNGDVFLILSPQLPVDVTRSTLHRPAYPAHRFIVDECVKNLAPKLRMLGCDVLSDSRIHDKEIVEISATEKRVILTRDRGLLKRKDALWGRLIRTTEASLQLREVIQFFGLSSLPYALTKCLVCNGHLKSISKEEIWDQLAEKTKLYYNEFSQCDTCHKIYWEGSHYEKMKESLKDLSQVISRESLKDPH